MLKLLFFASCAEEAGVRESECDFCPTPKDILSRTGHLMKFQDLSRVWVAVNSQWADWDTALSDNDEVAFVPPVGG